MNPNIGQIQDSIESFRLEEAHQQIESILKENPSDPDILIERGIALALGQKEVEAVGVLTSLPEQFESVRQQQLVKLLSEHFHCRSLLARKLGVADAVGEKALLALARYDQKVKIGIALSACLIVKNEEKHLDRCLSSLKEFVDEIVVVDTGSTDRTIEIAEQHGAVIGHFSWIDDFASARNESLRLAKGDWVLWIDADEEVKPGSRNMILEALIRPHFGGYFIPIINFMQEGSDANRYVHTPVRLFRKLPNTRFEGRIHEQVIPSIREAGLPCATLGTVEIYHYGYQAQVMSEKDKLNRTISLLEREVADHPNDAFQWFNLANAYSVGRMADKANEAARRAADLMDDDAPFGPVTYQILASSLNSLGQCQRALDVVVEAEKRGFAEINVVFESAHALYRLKRYEEALSVARKVRSMDWPEGLTGDYGIKTHKTHVLEGQILLAIGCVEEAQNLIETALTVAPEFALAKYAMGQCLARQNRTEEAIQWLKEAANEQTMQIAASKSLATLHLELGDIEQAARLYHEVWAAEPRDIESWEGWVVCMERLGGFGQVREAYAQYEKVMGLLPEQHVNLGRSYLEIGEFGKAAEEFERAVQKNPAYANAYFNLGDLLYLLGRFQDAAGMFERGLKVEPQHAPGWFVLGNCFAQLGSLDGAEFAYRQALAIEPDYAEAQHNLECIASAA